MSEGPVRSPRRPPGGRRRAPARVRRPAETGWLDVTLPIHPGMVVFEGDPPVEVTAALALDRGDPANVSRLTLGSHTGTHVDAPSHFIAGGDTLDRVPLEAFMGPARVVEWPGGPIGRAALESAGALAGVARVLFRTGNSALWAQGRFVRDYQALTLDAAQALVAAGVVLVGADYLSVEAFGARGHPVHHCLLEAGVAILEGLDLSAVRPGRYELLCLPLRLRDGDGAPARALLRPLR